VEGQRTGRRADPRAGHGSLRCQCMCFVGVACTPRCLLQFDLVYSPAIFASFTLKRARGCQTATRVRPICGRQRRRRGEVPDSPSDAEAAAVTPRSPTRSRNAGSRRPKASSAAARDGPHHVCTSHKTSVLPHPRVRQARPMRCLVLGLHIGRRCVRDIRRGRGRRQHLNQSEELRPQLLAA
jgi:hypothetical protein